MKRKIFTLLVVAVAFVINANAVLDQTVRLTIYKAAAAPSIDGEGTDACWAETVSPLQVNDTVQSGTVGEGILAANFRMCWDDANFYILVNVTDPTPNVTGSTSWQSDCVELFFAMDTVSAGAYVPGNGHWQIRKQAALAQEETGAIDGSANVVPTLIPDANFKVVQTDGDTYTQEWQLPIATLCETWAWDGEFFGFDMMCTDNDGTGNERTGMLFFHSNANDQYNTVRSQGIVAVSPDPGPKVGVKNVKATSSISIRANYIQLSNTSDVNVYDITGKMVLKANNVSTISTSALKSGVYVVSANGQSKKFIK